MLARLMHDHKHIGILLKILKTKHIKLAAGEGINYNLVRDIVEYMQSYAEHSHHPLEEVISEFYWNKLGRAHINETFGPGGEGPLVREQCIVAHRPSGQVDRSRAVVV